MCHYAVWSLKYGKVHFWEKPVTQGLSYELRVKTVIKLRSKLLALNQSVKHLGQYWLSSEFFNIFVKNWYDENITGSLQNIRPPKDFLFYKSKISLLVSWGVFWCNKKEKYSEWEVGSRNFKSSFVMRWEVTNFRVHKLEKLQIIVINNNICKNFWQKTVLRISK